MSKRDVRKALDVALPRNLRRALRHRARVGDGLAATARRLLRTGDLSGVSPRRLERPDGRPMVLQLSRAEQRMLAELAARLQVSPQEAVRYALACLLDLPPLPDDKSALKDALN